MRVVTSNGKCIVGLAAVLLAASLNGQTTSGTISGEVQDSAAALIPDAKVTVTNEETGVRNETVTTTNGTFVSPALPPGRYTVSVSKAGFQTSTERNIPVSPTVVRTVTIVLQVGQVSTEVTVQAVTAQVQTATSEVSNYVGTQQVEILPLNGRNYQSLSALMPGVVNVQAGRALGTGGFETGNAMSINGMGLAGTYYTLDGIWNMNTGNMTQTTIMPNPDSILEIRTLQNNYSPKYSIMGASVVMIQTRSGTRNFHGALWEYLRNDKLDARNFFSPVVPAQKQNIFGGTLGGPLVIPKLFNTNREKTFFFVSAQGVVRNRGAVRRGATPTAEMRNGIFSQSITDPLTGQPFPQNASGQYVIPQSRLNPTQCPC